MRIGICLDLRNPVRWRRPWAALYAESLELAERADETGIDELWTTEHHFFDDGYLPQPLTMAAALAARTRRARIGTAIAIAPLRPAIQLAEDAAVIDAISGGRFDLGLGAGYRVPEFAAYGADHAGRFATLTARVREIRELFATERVTPPTVQPDLPIWLGLFSPQGARRAARLGTGLLSLEPGGVAAYLDELDSTEAGRRGGAVAGLIHGIVTDDPERTWGSIAAHVGEQLDSYVRYSLEGTGIAPPPASDPENLRRARDGARQEGIFPYFAVFTPDQAIARLRELAPPGVAAQAFFWGWIGGVPTDIAARHVELLASVVRPALRDV